MSTVRRVVCAANRHNATGTVVCGARHYDGVMRAVIHLLVETKVLGDGEPEFVWNDFEQGFIDNFGVFMTRTEAFELARHTGQLRRKRAEDIYDGAELFSEDLY